MQQGLRRIYVPQEPLFEADATVFEAVSEGVAEARALRERYEEHREGDDLDALQTRIEALDGWTWEQRVEHDAAAPAPGRRAPMCRRCRAAPRSASRWRRRWWPCPTCCCSTSRPTTSTSTPSSGCKACSWLERSAGAGLARPRLPRRVATRIVELDRGVLRSYPGNFAAYEATKERELESEALASARADKLLAQEEVWVRKGVEARRTRSVGRVERLERLREQRAARRDSLGQVRLEVDAGLPQRQDRRRAATTCRCASASTGRG